MEKQGCETYEYVLPTTVGARKVEAVLPEVGCDGPVRLDVDEIGVAGAWMPGDAQPQGEVVML